MSKRSRYRHDLDFYGRAVLAIDKIECNELLLAEFVAMTAVDPLERSFETAGRKVRPSKPQIAEWTQYLRREIAKLPFVTSAADMKLRPMAPPVFTFRIPLTILPGWPKYDVHIEDFEHVGLLIGWLRGDIVFFIVKWVPTADAIRVAIPRARSTIGGVRWVN